MPAQIGGRTFSNGQLILGGGLILALINWFIPWWWSWSESYSGSTGVPGFNSSAGISGFGLWSGILGFIVLLVLIALFAVRLFAPTAIPALPVADWMIYAIGGVLLFLFAVIFLTYAGGVSASGPGYSVSAGISIGFFIGLITAVAIAVGGYLTKDEPQAATKPLNLSSFGQTPPPPPPA